MFPLKNLACKGLRLTAKKEKNAISPTLLYQIVEHIEIKEHSAKFAEKLLVEHLFYTIFIATNKRTPGIFSHCINSQTRLTIRDTGVDIQYHGCLWHDDIRSLDIIRCDIDQVCTKYFLPPWKGLTLKTSDPILTDLVMAFRLMAVLSEIYWLLISEVLQTCHAKAILQQVPKLLFCIM